MCVEDLQQHASLAVLCSSLVAEGCLGKPAFICDDLYGVCSVCRVCIKVLGGLKYLQSLLLASYCLHVAGSDTSNRLLKLTARLVHPNRNATIPIRRRCLRRLAFDRGPGVTNRLHRSTGYQRLGSFILRLEMANEQLPSQSLHPVCFPSHSHESVPR